MAEQKKEDWEQYNTKWKNECQRLCYLVNEWQTKASHNMLYQDIIG